LRCAIPPAKLDHNAILSKKPEEHVAETNNSKAPKKRYESTFSARFVEPFRCRHFFTLGPCGDRSADGVGVDL
jgi:hypothetical protein